MSRWFVFATFVICVHNFPHGEVSVKVGVMEFGPYWFQKLYLFYMFIVLIPTLCPVGTIL